MAWKADFYVEADGSAPVEEFLAHLAIEQRAKALAIVKLLEETGPTLPFPYSSQVRGKSRELRTQQGKHKIRSLLFCGQKKMVHSAARNHKRSDKWNENEIAIAEQRMEWHTQRLRER